jgi:hypothetical protein
MEELLDQADALVHLAVTSGEQPLPNFPIPEALSKISGSIQLELRDDPWKGRGWFATSDIPVGTLVLLAKPIAKVMDWQEYDEGDVDDDDNNNEEEGGNDNDVEPLMNELLLIETLQVILQNPDIWHTQLSTLFPRNDSDLHTLPAWVCHNDDVFIQVENLLAQLEKMNKTSLKPPLLLPVKDIATRLPLIVRYNVLSMETCAELLSYPSPNLGHSSLAGIGLYHEPSFFNHSKQPNINRWCIGDVMGFVTNQEITAGTELCISYIEHDVLCEPPHRRNLMLSMDFLDTDEGDDNEMMDLAAESINKASNGTNTDVEQHSNGNVVVEENIIDDVGPSTTNGLSHIPVQTPVLPLNGGPEAPVVDSDVQNELMAMDPLERLHAIEELMLQAKGLKLPTDDTQTSIGTIINDNDDDPPQNHWNESTSTMDLTESLPSDNNDTAVLDTAVVVATPWFQCDVHNLRILKAITYDGLDMSPEAYQEWNESIQFVQTHLPPHDESLVVLHVQAALCAYHCYCKKDDRLHQQPPHETNDSNVDCNNWLTIAQKHAKLASETHNILFGGGNAFLRRRFKNEWQLTLRPTRSHSTVSNDNSINAMDVLWPLH